MLRCVKAHVVESFGPIPVGSLWADDSEFIVDRSAFVDASTPEQPKPVKSAAKAPAKASPKSKES